jgi:hypothetical protein
LIGFQAILFLLQYSRKYKVVHILANLPHLDTAVRPNGEPGHASRNYGPFPDANLISTAIDANANAELYLCVCSYLLYMYPL